MPGVFRIVERSARRQVPESVSRGQRRLASTGLLEARHHLPVRKDL
ncbi:MAG TPA: hypothetical protein VLK55_00025 [Kocuria rosea]|jgi:hypothetical protein|nr:hypothetical protein [Kocuria rosea]